jgi:hypothetical protein
MSRAEEIRERLERVECEWDACPGLHPALAALMTDVGDLLEVAEAIQQDIDDGNMLGCCSGRLLKALARLGESPGETARRAIEDDPEPSGRGFDLAEGMAMEDWIEEKHAQRGDE